MKHIRTITLEEIAKYLGVSYAMTRDYYANEWLNNVDFPLKEGFPKKPYRFNRQRVMAFFRMKRNRKTVARVNKCL